MISHKCTGIFLLTAGSAVAVNADWSH